MSGDYVLIGKSIPLRSFPLQSLRTSQNINAFRDMYGLLTSDVARYDCLITKHVGHETKRRVHQLPNVARRLCSQPFQQAFLAGQ